MTAIHAPGRQFDRVLDTGIRPFDIGRDLRSVAELISVAFATELDDRGAAALREMRFMSHFSGILGVVNRSTGDFSDMLNGFVWVDRGSVVGNITVQRADRNGNRWQIANVAVAPSHRGRGISRQLMETAVDHVASCGGQWAVLQVYARNNIARGLYDSLGFETISGIAELRAASPVLPIAPVHEPPLVEFSASDWQPLYELANHQLGAQAQWWRALRRNDFELTFEDQAGEWLRRVLGQRTILRRAVQVSPRFEAAAILTAQRWGGEHQIQLWTRPEHYGYHDIALLDWALATLRSYPRMPVALSINTDETPAIDWLESAGFTVQRTLLTMRLRVDGHGDA